MKFIYHFAGFIYSFLPIQLHNPEVKSYRSWSP